MEDDEQDECIIDQINQLKLTKLEMIGIKCHSDKFDFDWPKSPLDFVQLM